MGVRVDEIDVFVGILHKTGNGIGSRVTEKVENDGCLVCLKDEAAVENKGQLERRRCGLWGCCAHQAIGLGTSLVLFYESGTQYA